MALKNHTFISVEVPDRLWKRAERLKKELGMTFRQMVTDALTERVDYLETKLRYDEEQEAKREREKLELRAKRREVRSLEKLGDRVVPSLRPVNGPRPIDEIDEPKEVVAVDPLIAVYREQGVRLAEVMSGQNNPLERRVRVMEAVEAVKKAAPLTHPSDESILRRLEAEVVGLLKSKPSQPVSVDDDDEKPEKVIDTSRTRTLGADE